LRLIGVKADARKGRSDVIGDILCLFADDGASRGDDNEMSLFDGALSLDRAQCLAHDALGSRSCAGTADLFGHGKAYAVDVFLLRMGFHQPLGGKITQNVNSDRFADVAVSLLIRFMIEMMLAYGDKFHIRSFSLVRMLFVLSLPPVVGFFWGAFFALGWHAKAPMPQILVLSRCI
jgi:hypothetical protein